jgi:hypothetical protein
MSTGAILSEDEDEVVKRTAEAVALVRLGAVRDADTAARMRALAASGPDGVSALLDEREEVHALPERFVLTAEPPAIAELLSGAGDARWLFVAGALPQRFLDGLVPAVRRSRRELTVAVPDPTRLFLADRSVAHYARAGIELSVLNPIDLLALSVNPVAPQSHSFDSGRLRGLLAEAIPGLPIFDVLHASYAADGAMRARGAMGRTPRGVAPGSA